MTQRIIALLTFQMLLPVSNEVDLRDGSYSKEMMQEDVWKSWHAAGSESASCIVRWLCFLMTSSTRTQWEFPFLTSCLVTDGSFWWSASWSVRLAVQLCDGESASCYTVAVCDFCVTTPWLISDGKPLIIPLALSLSLHVRDGGSETALVVPLLLSWHGVPIMSPSVDTQSTICSPTLRLEKPCRRGIDKESCDLRPQGWLLSRDQS